VRILSVLCRRTWLVAGLLAAPAWADLQDEIQVYDDGINAPGEFHLEVHLNGTPSGRSTPEYPGEITPDHGIRLTPEFSYGLTADLEAGLYVPAVRAADGSVYVAGARVRMKWIPVHPAEHDGFFAGLNFELSDVAHRFEPGHVLEVRPMLGWRGTDWLVAVNPVLDFTLSGPERHEPPDFAPSIKVARSVAKGLALGFEYYDDAGPISGIDPFGQQSRTLYLAVDVDRAPWVFNFGVGRGFGEESDAWTVKAIFEIPL
jgi:hypothetical protein